MSRLPRSEVIDESEVGVYHCWNQFVRQWHLAGVDPVTGIDRSERKGWFVERLEELAHVFLIDVDSFAIMSTDDGWVLIRLSGTEPIVRVYTETTQKDNVRAILQDGLKIAGLK